MKTEDLTRSKKSKRVYLNDMQTRDLMKQLDTLFESFIDGPRMRGCTKQPIETLINEESLLFAKFLRDEQEAWIPKVNKTKEQ